MYTMSMKQLPYIEDFIKLMAIGQLIWPVPNRPVKLARYDEPIIDSMGEQISTGTGFTDKQSVLAHKLVLKYRKQLGVLGYDVSNHDPMPKFLHPIRVIDRSKVIDIDGQFVVIKFPYDQNLISQIRAAVTEIPGRLFWDKEHRYWCAGLLENRILWAKEFGNKYDFQFGSNFNIILERILNQNDYAIELKIDDNVPCIVNAAESLQNYVNENIGFNMDRLLSLIDHSALLGYTVDQNILQAVKNSYGLKLTEMLINRQLTFKFADYESLNLDTVFNYAEITNRWPICVYETGSNVLKKLVEQRFNQNQILSKHDHTVKDEILNNYKVIYFTHWKTAPKNIKLLVSFHTLLIGHRRQHLEQISEKVFYCTQVVNHND